MSKTTAPTSGAKAHPSEANKPAQTNETTPTVTQSAAVVATAAEDAAIPAVASDTSAIRATDDGLPDELPLAPIRPEHDDLFARGQQPASSVADQATAAVKNPEIQRRPKHRKVWNYRYNIVSRSRS